MPRRCSECRAIVAERAGPDASGACWAMIRERWHQFLFGFYPQDQYWRPILAFVLLFVAIAPVLFLQLPRKMLWFTILYPATAFFLLWGGSIWAPIVAMFGLRRAGDRLSRCWWTALAWQCRPASAWC